MMQGCHIFPLLLLLWQARGCWGNGPPRMNVTDGQLVVNTTTQPFFSLRCEGSQKIHWGWDTEFEDHVIITETQHPNTDHPFVSVMQLEDPQRGDNGWYYCYYEGAGNWHTDIVNVDKAYVFVHDGTAGFVDAFYSGIIQKTTSQKLVIPCRTTLPNLPVTLTKDGIDITNNARVEAFDPKVGFVLRDLVLQDAGMYFCKNDRFRDPYMVHVGITTSTEQNLPQPAIIKGEGQLFVVGHSFRLNCSLIYDGDVVFRWTLPNPNADYSTSKSALRQDQSQYRISTLTMHNVTLADSGNYMCAVTAPRHNSNNHSIYVEVLETMVPFINITTDLQEIEIEEGDTLKWKSLVIAHPSDPELIYYNWTGIEIKESSKVNTEHHAMSAESWLRVYNVTPFDHGQYTLKGITKDKHAKDSVSVYVKIRSKPLPWLEDVPEYILPNATVNVTCTARGFPLPSTHWQFKSCPAGTHNCTSTFTELQISDSVVTTPDPGNNKTTKVTFQPQTSGRVRCRVTNSEGSNYAVADLPISDVGGLLVLRHTIEGITRDVQDGKDSIDVVMNDRFQLLCAATKFKYASSTLTFSGSGPRISVNESEWSWQNVVGEEAVTKDHQGMYTCTARSHNGVDLLVKTLHINVHDEKEVEFLPDATLSPSGQTVLVKEKTSYTLNCTVTGVPPPSVTWFKDNEELKPSSDFFDNETTFLSADGQRLEIKYVFREKHVGHYMCRAENRLNQQQGYINIDVPKRGMSFGTKIGLAASGVGIILLVVVVAMLLRCVKTERQFRKSFRRNELYLFEKGNLGQLNPSCTADEQAELLPYGQEWEVPRQDIKIGKQLGSGAFGRVVKAVVTGLEEDQPNTTVAIKMCKSTSDPSQVRSLALELKIMIHLGKHLNIVNLMGASTVNIGKGELWILVEYCRFGNILSFLHRHRHHFVNQINPATGQLDLTLTTHHPISPLSPGSREGVSGFRPAPVTDQDGYLAPSSNKFMLADPPKGRISMAHTTSDSSESGSGSQQIVNNPLYAAGGISSDSGSTEEGVKTEPEPVLNTQQPANPPLSPASTVPLLPNPCPDTTRPLSCPSDTSSHGYLKSNVVVNTDMTTVHSPAASRHASPPPFSPSILTHPDSSGVSEVGVDSQGNPFTHEVGSVPGVTAPFTTSDLICWAWQVAQGMDYLSSRKVLHGDLAARNLLLADHNVIKISDFGLSRDMYKKDIYMKKADDLMPVKWISVEAIRDRIFSVQSDVWAYGVTLWELFSLGSVPYPGIEVNKDFLSLLESSYRMNRPKYANQDIYDLLLRCWAAEPMERPSFRQAAEYLGTLMLPDLRGEYMTMNDPYMRMNEERFQTQTDYLNMMSSPDFHNLTRGEEEVVVDGVGGHTYINIQPSSDESDKNRHYLRMNSPTPSTNCQPSPHYLPMSPTSPSQTPTSTPGPQSTPSPMANVFSPRPGDSNRFTFVPGTENNPKLPEVTEEEDESCTTPASEKSILIIDDKQEDGKVDLGRSNGEVAYTNLPKTDPNYINM